MTDNATLTANIRTEISRQRRTYQSVADAAGIDGRQFRSRCREEAKWTFVEGIAVAAALDVPIEVLIYGRPTSGETPAERLDHAERAILRLQEQAGEMAEHLIELRKEHAPSLTPDTTATRPTTEGARS